MVKISDSNDGKIENKRRKLVQGVIWATPIVAGVSLPQHAHASAVPTPMCQAGQLMAFSDRSSANPGFVPVDPANHVTPFICGNTGSANYNPSYSNGTFPNLLSNHVGFGYDISDVYNGDFQIVFEQNQGQCELIGDNQENFYQTRHNYNMDPCVIEALSNGTATVSKAMVSMEYSDFITPAAAQGGEAMWINDLPRIGLGGFNQMASWSLDLLTVSGVTPALVASTLVTQMGRLDIIFGDDIVPASLTIDIEVQF